MILSGCKTSDNALRQAAEVDRARQTPAKECRRVYRKTPDPALAEGDDAITKSLPRYKAALALSNRRGAEAAACADTAADRGQ